MLLQLDGSVAVLAVYVLLDRVARKPLRIINDEHIPARVIHDDLFVHNARVNRRIVEPARLVLVQNADGVVVTGAVVQAVDFQGELDVLEVEIVLGQVVLEQNVGALHYAVHLRVVHARVVDYVPVLPGYAENKSAVLRLGAVLAGVNCGFELGVRGFADFVRQNVDVVLQVHSFRVERVGTRRSAELQGKSQGVVLHLQGLAEFDVVDVVYAVLIYQGYADLNVAVDEEHVVVENRHFEQVPVPVDLRGLEDLDQSELLEVLGAEHSNAVLVVEENDVVAQRVCLNSPRLEGIESHALTRGLVYGVYELRIVL